MLLALLGVGATSCIVPCMYGTPNADWTVKGKVVDEAGKPVAGLQVVLGNQYENSEQVIYDQNYWPLDTLQTAGDGTYHLESNGFPIQQLEVHVQDIDGELRGGEYEDAHIIVKQIEYKDGKIVNEDEFERAQTKLINEEYLDQQGKHTDPQDFIDNPEVYIFGEQAAEEQAPAPKSKKKKEKSKK